MGKGRNSQLSPAGDLCEIAPSNPEKSSTYLSLTDDNAGARRARADTPTRRLPCIRLTLDFRDRLEHRGVEVMALQQLVELGAIALRQSRRLRHVAIGDLEQLGQIIALELEARGLER